MKKYTDEEKDRIVEQLISTDEGRKYIVNLALKTGTMKELGEAIIKTIENFGESFKVSK